MGRALHGLGVLAAERGDLAGARIRIEEGLALSRAAGDRPFVGLALHNLGSFAVREHDEQTARSRIEESRRVWEELGSRGRLSLAAHSLGDLARSGGTYAEAAAHYRESLELAGAAGPPGWRTETLRALGHATHLLGDDRAARAHFTEALRLCRDLGDRRGVAECVGGLACLAAGTQPGRAVRLLGAATAAVAASGPYLSRSDQDDFDRSLAASRSRLGDGAYEAAWRRGQAMSLEQAVADALEEAPAAPDAA